MNTVASVMMAAGAAPLEWNSVMPLLVVMGTAVLAVLVEAIRPAAPRRVINTTLTLVALAMALCMVGVRWHNLLGGKPAGNGGQIMGGHLVENTTVLAFQAVLLLCALLAAIVVAARATAKDGAFINQAADRPGSAQENYAIEVGYQRTEIFPLLLFSTGGMMAFIGAGNLLTLFVALEAMSLPLYVMAAMGRRRRLLSQESGFKYFLLGAYASGFFLMGAALLYGYSGTLSLAGIAYATAVFPGYDWMLLTGTALLLVGLFFKVGAVPFHAWTPDVYQGAPSPITGFMAAGVKIAAFAALLRIVTTAVGGLQWDLAILLWAVAIASMVIGTFIGIVQTDVKRMLAYSSIAHVGFLLIAVVAGTGPALSASMFYLLCYGIASVGAFALVALVRDVDSDGGIRGEATALRSWRGLGKTHPVLATSMLIFLLSFAGIPLTGGFMGKLLLFLAGYHAGAGALVFAAIVASAITAFYYFRLAALMFFEEPDPYANIPAGDVVTKTVVVVCAVLTVVLGVMPQVAIDAFNQAAISAVSATL